MVLPDTAMKPILYTHINWPGFSSWHQRSLHMEWEVRKCNYGDPHPPPPAEQVSVIPPRDP